MDAPEGFEAGVQNYPGQIGAGPAIDYLTKLGMHHVASHEKELNRFLSEELMRRYGEEGWFKIIGPSDPAMRGGILTFEVARPNAVGIAEELSERSNIMIRLAPSASTPTSTRCTVWAGQSRVFPPSTGCSTAPPSISTTPSRSAGSS